MDLDVEKSVSRKQKYYESSAGDGTKPSEHYIHGYKLLATLLACFVSLLLGGLDSTIVITLFTAVGNEFDAFDKINWLSTAFLLPLCVLSPSYGTISIVLGRKLTLSLGIIVFEIGSLIAGLANSMDMLIGARVIQGAGAGAIVTTVGIIVTEAVPINYRSYSLSIMAISFSIATVLGPFIGGALTSNSTWRWCFYINLPLGGVAFGLLMIGFHPPKPPGTMRERAKKLDFTGNILLILGLVLPMVGGATGGVDYPWYSPGPILIIPLGILCLIIFFMYNYIVSKNQLFLKQFFTVPQILASGLSGFFNYAFFLGDITYLIIYFQEVFGHSSFQSGIDILPLIVSVTVFAIINGIFIKLTRLIKPFYVFSGCMGMIGCGLTLLINRETPTAHRIVFLIVMGISVGSQIQCTLLSCQLKAPKDVPGGLISTTTFANFMRFLGGAVGVISASIVFNSDTNRAVTKIIDGAPYSVQEEFLTSSPTAILSQPVLLNKLPEDIRNAILNALMAAIHKVFKMGVAWSSASFVSCLFATNRRIPKASDVMTNDAIEEEDFMF